MDLRRLKRRTKLDSIASLNLSRSHHGARLEHGARFLFSPCNVQSVRVASPVVEPSEHPAPVVKPAAPLITGLKREKIVTALAAGESARFIAKSNGHDQSTVRAIRDADAVRINAVKERLAVQAAGIARLAGQRIAQRLRKDSLADHLLPTTFGIAIDKMLALRGDDRPAIGLTLNLLNNIGND
jgi:hypothetical protein